MNQALINVVQGDENYSLSFNLTDFLGAVVNLTGSTLTFKAQLISDPVIQFSASMAITNVATGACEYTVNVTDFPVAGTYNCQIVVFYTATTEQVTFDGIQVIADARVPQ